MGKLEKHGKMAELESMFRKYPDVPKESIIQSDVLTQGLDCTASAGEMLTPYATKAYSGFSWDRVLADAKQVKVPDSIHITGGMYGLRGTTGAEWHVNPGSPYIVDTVAGKLYLCVREKAQHIPIADMKTPHPRPKYKDKCFPDGTTYGEVVDAVPGRPFTRFLPLRTCQRWDNGEQCLYCDINVNAQRLQKLGKRTISSMVDDLDKTKEAFREVYLREKWPPGTLPHTILISGGTILDTVDGLNEDDFYMRYVEAIVDAVGYRWPISLQTKPHTPEVCKRMRAGGVVAHEANLEVWDERLFNILCPSKARYTGWQHWIDMLCDEVNVFGEGNVSTAIVVGVEMCQPYGFKTIDEAVKSTMEGFDYLMSRGVLPRPIQWIVEPGTGLAGNTPAPLEYFIRVFSGWHELWEKYGLPPVQRYPIMGPGREQADRAWASMGW